MGISCIIYGRHPQVAVHGLNGLLLMETSTPGSSPAVAINSDGRLDAFVMGGGSGDNGGGDGEVLTINSG